MTNQQVSLPINNDMVTIKTKFTCEICKMICKTAKGLEYHCRAKHVNDKNILSKQQPMPAAKACFCCEICKYVCNSEKILKQHIQTKHKISQFRCELCNKKQKTNKSLERHIKNKHIETENKIKINKLDSQEQFLNNFYENCHNLLEQITPKKHLISKKIEIFNNIKKLISDCDLFPNHEICLYGSIQTESWINSLSIQKNNQFDFDITIQDSKQLNSTKDQYLLYKLYKQLEMKGYTSEFIKAKTKLVRFNYHGYDVDLTQNNNNALKNSKLIKLQINQDPIVYQLILMVKFWAKNRNVCNVKNKSLSSYTWTLLAIFQLRHIKLIPNLQSRDTYMYSQDIIELIADKHIIISEDLPFYYDKNNFSKQMSITDLIDQNNDEMRKHNELLKTNHELKLNEVVFGFFSYYSAFNWDTMQIDFKNGVQIQNNDNQTQTQKIGLRIIDPFEQDRNLGKNANQENLIFELRETQSILIDYVLWPIPEYLLD